MAKLDRKNLTLFGNAGSASYFGKFGSKKAGTAATSQDPAVIQALSAWTTGWQDAIVTGNKAAYLQDMNGWCYVHSYMVAYLYQQGIPEWNTDTVYFQNSVVQGTAALGNAGQWFNSLQDNNTGNAPPVGASNALWQWVNAPVNLGVGNSLISKLLIRTNSGVPNTRLDVSADLLSVQGTILTAFSFLTDITAAGVNGLDSGAAASSTWYAVHVICNADGTLKASLLSLSATTPTLPSGYTKFRRVGWVRNTGASVFYRFYQEGDTVLFEDTLADTVYGGYTATTLYTTSFSAYLPPGTIHGIFDASASATSTSTAGGTSSANGSIKADASVSAYRSFISSGSFDASQGRLGSTAFAGMVQRVSSSQTVDLTISIYTSELQTGVSLAVSGYIDPQ